MHCDEIVDNKCIILDPDQFNAKTDLKLATQYMCKTMHHIQVDKKKFILLPYFESKHSCLIVICPLANMVMVMDSTKLSGVKIGQCKNIFTPLKETFMQYIQEGGKQCMSRKNQLIYHFVMVHAIIL